jgi:diacylglycerol kinase family enzyme
MIAFLVLDLGLGERAPQLGSLRVRDAKRDVCPWPVALVNRDGALCEVRHHGMALGPHDACAEEALVEKRTTRRIGTLDGYVVDAWHCAWTMKRAVLIVNPHASRVTEEGIAAVERALMRTAYLRTLRTERPRHAMYLARQIDDADALIVFSGDGGFNEVLNGVDRDDLPIGFVPGGGTSVLPRALGMPRDPVEAAQQIADAIDHGRSRRISTARVNGRRFAFSSGIGLDAEAVRRIDERGRTADGKRPGDLAFISAFAKMLFERRGRFDPVLEIEGYGRAALVLVSLDFLAPVSLTPRTLPPLLFSLASGRPARNSLRGHDLDRVDIRCDHPLPLQADGEDLGNVTEAHFEAERGAVSVLA